MAVMDRDHLAGCDPARIQQGGIVVQACRQGDVQPASIQANARFMALSPGVHHEGRLQPQPGVTLAVQHLHYPVELANMPASHLEIVAEAAGPWSRMNSSSLVPSAT